VNSEMCEVVSRRMRSSRQIEMKSTPFLDTPNRETEGLRKGRGRISASISRWNTREGGEGDQKSGTEMHSAKA